MTEPRNSSDIFRSHTMEQQTETSPLKKNDTKKNWFNSLWKSTESEEGSLRTIVLNFFGFTVIVTVALLIQLYYGNNQTERHGSVASDSYQCSKIGVDILKKGGNSVDAAIAAAMCLGVVNFHITGLGGGGYMIIYNHRKLEVLDIIDFQAAVPNSLDFRNFDRTVEGLTVGVPGTLLGFWEAQQKFGKLSWKEIIMPAYKLAKYGFMVEESIKPSLSYINPNSKNNIRLKQFLNTLQEGKNVTFPALANTLELVSATGPDVFYNGSLGMVIINSVNKANGTLTLNDLSQYRTSHSELLNTKFSNFNVLSSGSSSGGALLLGALNNIQYLDLSSGDDVPSIILKMSDILHDAYVSFLKKNKAIPGEFGSVASQVLVTDAEDLYVAIVSGLNTWLGSQILTESGFILNNAVINGGINHEGRPLSFYAPVIAVENNEICGKRVIMGSGDAIIAAQVLTYSLYLKNNVNASVESPRFFIDNVPRHIMVEDMHEPFFNPKILNKLKSSLKIERISPPYKSVNAIEKIEDTVTAHSDSRSGGRAKQFR